MDKSPDAFRTISEVADWLGVQAHVLRFWESKFTHVKPVKRAGGRRYYRPADMQLLGGIKKLLHEDGMTIKGVQKILREQGVTHVSAMSQALDDMAVDANRPRRAQTVTPHSDHAANTSKSTSRAAQTDEAQIEMALGQNPADDLNDAVLEDDMPDFGSAPSAPSADVSPQEDAPLDSAPAVLDGAPDLPSDPAAGTEQDDPVETPMADATTEPTEVEAAPPEAPMADDDAAEAEPMPTFRRRPLRSAPAEESPEPEAVPDPITPEPIEPDIAQDAFETAQEDIAAAPEIAHPEEDAAPEGPRARVVDAPDPPDEDDIEAAPGVLSQVATLPHLPEAKLGDIATLAAALDAWRVERIAQRNSAN